MKILQNSLITLALLFGMATSSFLFAQGDIKLDKHQYKVVINHEEQYSLWLAGQKAPAGWKDTRFSGTRKECQEHIQEVWTDMRPLSLQKMNLPSKTRYQVVINHEEQYSIWPLDRKLPAGWEAAGETGTKQECLDYIEEVWTDMRPLSLRKKMEEDAKAEK